MSKTDPIYVLDKRVQLRQPENGFRTAIDAVLLAAACPAKPGQTLLDLGCGVGSAGLCALRRIDGVKLTGIDIQDDHIELARENAALNNLTAQTQFITANVADYTHYQNGKNALFDHIICNPPYNDNGAHTRSPSAAKARAMGHDETTLQDWINCANRNLKSGGSFTLIHKADQIDAIILGLGDRFGSIEIIPLWPKTGEAAKRVIIRARKDSKSPAKLHPGIVLHQNDGSYSAAAEEILRNMAPLN